MINLCLDMRWQAGTGETLVYPYHITSIRKATPDGYKVDLRTHATGNLADVVMSRGDARHPAQFDKHDPHYHTLARPNTRTEYARMGPRDTIESKNWILEVYAVEGHPLLASGCDAQCQNQKMTAG